LSELLHTDAPSRCAGWFAIRIRERFQRQLAGTHLAKSHSKPDRAAININCVCVIEVSQDWKPVSLSGSPRVVSRICVCDEIHSRRHCQSVFSGSV